MFIIHDTKEKLLAVHEPFAISCPHCGKTGRISYKIYQKYLRFFWIPFIPVKKIIRFSCTYCQTEKLIKPNSSDYSPDMAEFKRTVRTKPYYFSGLILLLLFFVYLTAPVILENIQSKRYLRTPLVNDTYEMRDSVKRFRYYARVTALKADSVTLVTGYISKSDPAKIKEDIHSGFFIPIDSFSIERKQLLTWFRNDIIERVHRRK